MANIGELVRGFPFSDGSGVAVIGDLVADTTLGSLDCFVIENMPSRIGYPTKNEYSKYLNLDAVKYLSGGHYESGPNALYPLLNVGDYVVGTYLDYDSASDTYFGPTLAIAKNTGSDFKYFLLSSDRGLGDYDLIEEPFSNYFVIYNNYDSLSPTYPYKIGYNIRDHYSPTGTEFRSWTPYEELYIGKKEDEWLQFIGSAYLRYVEDGVVTPITEDDTKETPNPSGTGGGDGSFDPNSDDVTIPDLPNLSAVGSGMITLYNPTLSQLQSFAGYLWSDSTDFFENLSKMWNDPTDAIISLGIYPFVVPHGVYKNVKIGNMNTNISMPTTSGQYIAIDCGEVYFDKYFGSSLDYNPYTRVSIFLPFVGVQQLNTDDVMSAYIKVVYNIDLLTGAFAVVVKSRRGKLDSVLYHYSGNMMSPIPITSNDFSGLYNSVVQLAGGVTQVLTGNAGAGAGSIASAVFGSKETIGRSGQISGNSGLMDNMIPYLIIERPIQSLADNYNKFEGFPSNIASELGGLSGYTSIESVISNTLTCPQSEQDEIIGLLKSGVYL